MFKEKVAEFKSMFSVMAFEEAKAEYWKLAKKFHPDINKDVDSEIFKALSNAWDSVKDSLANSHGETHGKSAKYGAWATSMFDALMKTAIELSKIPGLEVVIAGSWIWVYGDTKENKDSIKKVVLEVPNKYGGTYTYHAKYSSKKQAWYFAGVKSSGKGNMSLDEIFTAYDTTQVKHNEQGLSR